MTQFVLASEMGRVAAWPLPASLRSSALRSGKESFGPEATARNEYSMPHWGFPDPDCVQDGQSGFTRSMRYLFSNIRSTISSVASKAP